MTSPDAKRFAELERELAELKAKLHERTRMDVILAEAFSASPDLVSVTDLRSGKIVAANDAAKKLTGYSPQEWIGYRADIHDIWVDKDARDQFISWISHKGEDDYFEAKLRRKDGSEFSALITGIMVRYGDERFSVTSIRDISAIRETEEQLAFSNMKFSMLFQASYAPMMLVSVEPRKLIDINTAAAKLLKYDEELLGKDLLARRDMDKLWAIPGDRQRFRQDLTDNGFCEGLETTFINAEDEAFPVIAAGRILNINGLLCILFHLQDLTQQKVDEAELRSSTERLQTAQEVANVGDFHWDILTRTVSASKEGARLFGIEMENRNFAAAPGPAEHRGR